MLVKSERYIKVVIEGTIGNGYKSDIAIDDILLTKDACNAGSSVARGGAGGL